MLGALVNGNVSTASTFVVTYTDNTTTTGTQRLSDWVFPLNCPGETVITCVPYRNNSNGTQDANLTCVFGYQIALDSTKIVKSIQLPTTRNNVFLAMALVTPPVPGTLVYTPPSGIVLPTGANTLSAVFTPTDQTDFVGATASVLELVNPANPTTLVWPTPATITYGTALSSTQLNAVAQTTPGTTSVSLASYYRVNAFQSDGSLFSTGGFDNAGDAFSSNALGSSVVWNGQTYSLGPANLPSAVTSTTIALPQGKFAALTMIGAATTFGQTTQPFKITYTDGTNATVNISLSSWTVSLAYPGETIVAVTEYRNTGSGGRISTTEADLYGYQIALDNTKVVQSVTLPNNRNVVIVAMSLSTSSTPIAVPGTYVYTPPTGTIPAVGTVPLNVVFTPTDTNYLAATKTVNLVVNKAVLTVTANNQTIAFGSSLAPYTDTITGFVNGDAPSVVTGAASLSTIPATPTAAGTYPITAAQGTLAAANYSFAFVPHIHLYSGVRQHSSRRYRYSFSHLQANRHCRLKHRHPDGTDCRQSSDSADHMGHTEPHHIRHGALRHPVECYVNGSRNLCLHSCRRHRPNRGHSDPFGHLYPNGHGGLCPCHPNRFVDRQPGRSGDYLDSAYRYHVRDSSLYHSA